MESAMKLAKESFLKDEVPVGAVVVKENKIIGSGRNTVIADKFKQKNDKKRKKILIILIKISIFFCLKPRHLYNDRI